MDLIIIRLVFISVVAIACYHLRPFGLANFPAVDCGMRRRCDRPGCGLV